MFIIEKLNAKSNGALSVEFEFGKRYNTLEEANEECIRTLEYYKNHHKRLNKVIGEYLLIVEDNGYERLYAKTWYLFNGEIDYVRAISFEEIEEFAYSMAKSKKDGLLILMAEN